MSLLQFVAIGIFMRLSKVVRSKVAKNMRVVFKNVYVKHSRFVVFVVKRALNETELCSRNIANTSISGNFIKFYRTSVEDWKVLSKFLEFPLEFNNVN